MAAIAARARSALQGVPVSGSWASGEKSNGARTLKRPGPAQLAALAVSAATAAAAAPPIAVAAGALFRPLARRRGLRALDPLPPGDGAAVLVLQDQLEADAAAC